MNKRDFRINNDEKCTGWLYGWYHYEMNRLPLAAISATNIFVSARITSRPGLAKMKLADVIPKKNFPIKVPSSFHTCS
jgi:hypothetical protein